MTDEEIVKQIKKLRKEGVSISSIARDLGLSRPTVRKFLEQEHHPIVNKPYSESREGQNTHPFIQKTVIPVSNPSKRVVSQREDVEVTELEVRKEKATQELQKIQGPKEHPALSEKRARVEIVKLDLDEFEAQRKLEALREEERRRVQAEEQSTIREKMEAERERRRRGIIQRVKQAAFPPEIRQILSSPIATLTLLKIEQGLSQMDIENIPFEELVTYAETIKFGLWSEAPYDQEVRKSHAIALYQCNIDTLKKEHRQVYERYRTQGGELSYRDFICACAPGYSEDKKRILLEILLS